MVSTEVQIPKNHIQYLLRRGFIIQTSFNSCMLTLFSWKTLRKMIYKFINLDSKGFLSKMIILDAGFRMFWNWKCYICDCSFDLGLWLSSKENLFRLCKAAVCATSIHASAHCLIAIVKPSLVFFYFFIFPGIVIIVTSKWLLELANVHNQEYKLNFFSFVYWAI